MCTYTSVSTVTQQEVFANKLLTVISCSKSLQLRALSNCFVREMILMHAHTKTHIKGNTSWTKTTCRVHTVCLLFFSVISHFGRNFCIEVMHLWLTLSAVVGLMRETRSYCRRSRAHSAWRRPCAEMRNIEGSVWFPLSAFCQSYYTRDTKPLFIEWRLNDWNSR